MSPNNLTKLEAGQADMLKPMLIWQAAAVSRSNIELQTGMMLASANMTPRVRSNPCIHLGVNPPIGGTGGHVQHVFLITRPRRNSRERRIAAF